MLKIQDIKIKKHSLRELFPPKREEVVSPRRWRWIWWLAGFVVLLVAGYLVSFSLAQVTLEITPASTDTALTESVTATPSGSNLNFQVITLPAKTGSKEVKASGTEEVKRAASGQVIIYNNYNQVSQKLLATTRFQASGGKIYRIHDSLTVPGMKKDANGKLTPGSVEATIFADQSGAEYNSDPTDFTIPGFKADPRFSKFFARSKTPLTGGAVGTVPKLSADEETAARTALRADLTRSLLKDARFQIPQTSVLYDGLALIDFKDLTDWQAANANKGVLTLKESAVLRGVILPRVALAQQLIGTRVPNFSPNELKFANLDDLTVTFASPPGADLTNISSLSLSVRGIAHLVPIINQTDLSAKLAGVKSGDVDAILAAIKSINKAKVIFRPPWLGTVPIDSAKIVIKVAS